MNITFYLSMVQLVVVFFVIRWWRRRKRRIKGLFEQFKESKQNSPEQDTRSHLLDVVKELQVGKDKTLKDTSISPEQYLKKAFGRDSEIGIDRLVYNMIKVEFSEQVSEDFKPEDIRKGKAKSEMQDTQLKFLIQAAREDILGDKLYSFSEEVTFDPEPDYHLSSILFIVIGGSLVLIGGAIAFAEFF